MNVKRPKTDLFKLQGGNPCQQKGCGLSETDCKYLFEAPSGEDLAGVPQQICRVINELSILYHTARTLQSGENLHAVLEQTLSQMAETLGLYHGALRILNRANNEIMDEVSCGLRQEELLGESVVAANSLIEEVLARGHPCIVPDIRKFKNILRGDDPETLQKAGQATGETALISVPVSHHTKVLGVLTMIIRNKTSTCLESNLRLATLVGQLIAQAVQVRQHDREQIEYLRQENERLQNQIQRHFRPDNMIGNSRAMQTVYHSIEQVSNSVTTVLIRGESGVGKELVAHAIHHSSPRTKKPFVKVNCAALPETIVESELFGHERGAFTGAIAMRKGRFELAHTGTIFLDEIGELPLQTQAKLLRILQEREFERVGGTQTLKCDVRVIAATNRPLEEFVDKGTFRQDLYYRLNVFPIYVPALRERKTDILQLADFFIEKYNAANNKTIKRISTPAIDMLMSYHWPGNVRELENCIERASLLATDDVIHAFHLPPSLQTPSVSSEASRSTLQAALNGFEREMIIDALKANRGNMAAAARQLGLTERVMGLRVKKYSLDADSFKI